MTEEKDNLKNGMQMFKVFFKNKGQGCNDKRKLLGLKLIGIIPSFKILEKELYLEHLFPDGFIEEGFRNAGFEINASKFFLKVQDYVKLLEKIYPNHKITDCQSWRNGHPDFMLEDKRPAWENHKFYIEMKRNGDGIRASQLDWLLKNLDEEVYFLFIRENGC